MFREQIQQSAVVGTGKIFIGRSFLLLNTLTWQFMVRAIAIRLVELETPAIVDTFYLGAIVSVLVGAILSSKVRRLHLIFVWIMLGTFVSFLPLFWTSTSMIIQLTVNFLLGFSFGLGLPSCVASFAESTTFQNRGRMCGLIFLLSTLCMLPVLVLLQSNLLVISLASFLWRISGFFTLPAVKSIETAEKTTFSLVVKTRSFLLYFVPLLMFCFVDSFETIFFESFVKAEFLGVNEAIEPAFGAVFALVGGLLADRIGRKKVIIFGFVSLGIAYSVLGLAPYWVGSWYFYSIIDGVAWGIFYVMFALVLWGDIAHSKHRKEKYYAIGGIPFFLSEFIVMFFVPQFEILPEESALTSFSIAAFFLFLAVFPLMYAPETLPEKKIRKRELKQYIDKAKKIKEKYAKNQGS